MNYIKQLTGFFAKKALDPDITAYCISLYMSIFQRWNINRFKNPIYVIRNDLMNESKISSTATYHRCLKILIDHDYVAYKASYSAGMPSRIQVYDLSEYVVTNSSQSPKDPQRISDVSLTKTESTTKVLESDLEEEHPPNKKNASFLDLKNKKKSIENYVVQAKEQNSEQADVHVGEQVDEQVGEHLLKTEVNTDKKQMKTKENEGELSPGPEDNFVVLYDKTIPPKLEVVESFFLNSKSTVQEAQKFVLHYTANGWLVSGKSKMINWQACAHSWILRIDSFKSKNNERDRAKHLRATTNKRYDEPY